MMSDTGRPRDLLWFYQLQKENRHLLDRLNSQEADVTKLKIQLSTSERDKSSSEQALSELKATQRTALERSREDFEREKELLKRVVALEASIKALGAKDGDDDNSSNDLVICLEERVKAIEQQQSNQASPEMSRISERVESLEKRLSMQMGPPENHVFMGEQEKAACVQKVATMAILERREVEGDKVLGRVSTASKTTEPDEIVKGTTLEKNKALSKIPSKTCATSKPAKSDSIGKDSSKRQASDAESWPVLLQKKRRRSRELRIPFRPTPPDMYW